MIGDTFNTQYFGQYTEERDTDLTANEFVGKVSVRTLNGQKAAFLYVPGEVFPIRFDLPEFMQKYDKQRVAILGRPFQKQVGEKTYNKLVVISAKTLEYILGGVGAA